MNTVANTEIRVSIKSKQSSRAAMMGFQEMSNSTCHLTSGCSCKNSKCSKKYCECFQAGRQCNHHCKCNDCQNGHPGCPEAFLNASEEVSRTSSKNQKSSSSDAQDSIAKTQKTFQETKKLSKGVTQPPARASQ